MKMSSWLHCRWHHSHWQPSVHAKDSCLSTCQVKANKSIALYQAGWQATPAFCHHRHPLPWAPRKRYTFIKNQQRPLIKHWPWEHPDSKKMTAKVCIGAVITTQKVVPSLAKIINEWKFMAENGSNKETEAGRLLFSQKANLHHNCHGVARALTDNWPEND